MGPGPVESRCRLVPGQELPGRALGLRSRHRLRSELGRCLSEPLGGAAAPPAISPVRMPTSPGRPNSRPIIRWWPTRRGVVRLRAGDAAGAAADFTRTLELNPAYLVARVNRAAARIQLGDFNGATCRLRQCTPGRAEEPRRRREPRHRPHHAQRLRRRGQGCRDHSFARSQWHRRAVRAGRGADGTGAIPPRVDRSGGSLEASAGAGGGLGGARQREIPPRRRHRDGRLPRGLPARCRFRDARDRPPAEGPGHKPRPPKCWPSARSSALAIATM